MTREELLKAIADMQTGNNSVLRAASEVIAEDATDPINREHVDTIKGLLRQLSDSVPNKEISLDGSDEAPGKVSTIAFWLMSYIADQANQKARILKAMDLLRSLDRAV